MGVDARAAMVAIGAATAVAIVAHAATVTGVVTEAEIVVATDGRRFAAVAAAATVAQAATSDRGYEIVEASQGVQLWEAFCLGRSIGRWLRVQHQQKVAGVQMRNCIRLWNSPDADGLLALVQSVCITE